MGTALKITQSHDPVDAAAIIEALPDVVLAVSARGEIFYSNQSAQSFFNLGGKALSTKKAGDLFGVAHPVTEALASFFKTGQSRRVQQDAESISIVPLGDKALVVIRKDIAEIRNDWIARIRHSLKPAQHMARMLAHEIKNPLAGIRGAAQLLMKASLPADDHELAGLIDSEAARVLRMIDKVNVFDDPAGVFTPVNIHEILDHVIKMVTVKVSCHYDPSLPDMNGDRDRLVQAFLNILKNAQEAGAKKILVRTSYATSPGFHPETGLKLPLTVEIEDDGHGMNAETKARIFDPYYTTKPAGEGLGLAIVSKIIDDHNGVADVESGAGKTIFRFSFPRSPK